MYEHRLGVQFPYVCKINVERLSEMRHKIDRNNLSNEVCIMEKFNLYFFLLWNILTILCKKEEKFPFVSSF